MKRNNLLAIFIAALILSVSGLSFAAGSSGYTFAPAVFYMTQTVDDGTPPDSKDSDMIIDVRLGYTMPSGLYFGVDYQTYSYNLSSTETGTHTHLGPSIGFWKSGFNLVFSYLLQISQDVSTTTAYKGTGYDVDLGYAADMGSWALGPQFTYYSHTYTKSDTAGTETDLANDLVVSGVIPKFAFWFFF